MRRSLPSIQNGEQNRRHSIADGALSRMLPVLFLAVGMLSTAGIVHAQPNDNKGRSSEAPGQAQTAAQHERLQDEAASSAPSTLFPRIEPIASPILPLTPAPPQDTATSSDEAATPSASTSTEPVPEHPIATSTPPVLGKSAPADRGGPPAIPSALLGLKEKLFPSSAYPSDHLSVAATRAFMLLAGLCAAAGVTFLVYGMAAALAHRRAAQRRFRRVPVAVR